MEDTPNTVAVSVIMPAYNAEAHIASAIESLVAQTRADWELLVVDDGSSDHTIEKVTSFGDSRIRVLETSHSGLPAVARNRAIEEARGRYIAFLDADDVWQEEKLSKQLTAFESDPAVDGVFCNRYAMTDEGPVEADLPAYAPEHGSVFTALLSGNCICTSSVILKKSLLDRYGAFDPEPGLRTGEDCELWFRITPWMQWKFMDEALVGYRVSDESITGTIGMLRLRQVHTLLLKRTRRQYPFQFADYLRGWSCAFRNRFGGASESVLFYSSRPKSFALARKQRRIMKRIVSENALHIAWELRQAGKLKEAAGELMKLICSFPTGPRVYRRSFRMLYNLGRLRFRRARTS